MEPSFTNYKRKVRFGQFFFKVILPIDEPKKMLWTIFLAFKKICSIIFRKDQDLYIYSIYIYSIFSTAYLLHHCILRNSTYFTITSSNELSRKYVTSYLNLKLVLILWSVMNVQECTGNIQDKVFGIRQKKIFR